MKLTPTVILRAAFAPISYCQKITNTNFKFIKASKNTFIKQKSCSWMLVKLTAELQRLLGRLLCSCCNSCSHRGSSGFKQGQRSNPFMYPTVMQWKVSDIQTICCYSFSYLWFFTCQTGKLWKYFKLLWNSLLASL